MCSRPEGGVEGRTLDPADTGVAHELGAPLLRRRTRGARTCARERRRVRVRGRGAAPPPLRASQHSGKAAGPLLRPKTTAGEDLSAQTPAAVNGSLLDYKL